MLTALSCVRVTMFSGAGGAGSLFVAQGYVLNEGDVIRAAIGQKIHSQKKITAKPRQNDFLGIVIRIEHRPGGMIDMGIIQTGQFLLKSGKQHFAVTRRAIEGIKSGETYSVVV